VRAAENLAVKGPSKLLLAIEGRVATVTIGAGQRHNALAPEDWSELRKTASELATRDDISVVVFRGAAGTFSSGSDIRYWDETSAAQVDADFITIEHALQAVEAIPVPTIAAVEGIAVGAGCELALACDLRLVAESARIGMPILRLGVLVSPQFVLRLTLLIGVARARELLYLGRLLSATEADRMGIVNATVPDDQLSGMLAEWTERISNQPHAGLIAAKTASNVALERLRKAHEAPEWSFSDPTTFSERIRAFLTHAKH
jgi:enoyl-CoA hydratase